MNSIQSRSSFASEEHPSTSIRAAWNSAISPLGFVASHEIEPNEFSCLASFVTSALGIRFLKISSSAQTMFREAPLKDEALLLFYLIDGQADCLAGGKRTPIFAGDIFLCPPTPCLEFVSQVDFRALMSSIPTVAFNSRLAKLGISRSRVVPGLQGIGHILASLLAGFADVMSAIEPEELRSFDLMFLEALIAAAENRGVTRDDDTSGVQTAILRRIHQFIELKLNDPELNLKGVAREEGVSSRYLQKLFEKAGESFTHYLLRRRLERCADTLADPQFDKQSISEICFTWGFRDAAHFSRVFRDRFQKTPTEYRKKFEGNHYFEAPKATRGWSVANTDAQRLRRLASQSTLEIVPSQSGQGGSSPEEKRHDAPETTHHIRPTPQTVHWGYFSRSLTPVLEITSGDRVVIDTLTQHAYDDYDRMIEGDPDAEAVFEWTSTKKGVDRRGAGPMDSSVFGRGAGEGFGTQIMTGPIAVKDALPGDVLEVRFLDIVPRPCRNPEFLGRSFGSNAAAWWGFHFKEMLTEPKLRETVTIYEIFNDVDHPHARPIHSYVWRTQTDPFGVAHPAIDYPGVPVDHRSIDIVDMSQRKIEVPLRLHFGVVGVAPRENELVDSIPPSYFGGNLDNWRLGKGSRIYLPVLVPGAMLSIGDPHAAQGDSELSGTAIECSLTGHTQILLHKKDTLGEKLFRDLSCPLIETETSWILPGFSHANYLAALGKNAQSEIYKQSSIDLAMKDAFRKMRRLLMTGYALSEDEAISIMSVCVDFGVSQVVDGNWGVHAILPKSVLRNVRN